MGGFDQQEIRAVVSLPLPILPTFFSTTQLADRRALSSRWERKRPGGISTKSVRDSSGRYRSLGMTAALTALMKNVALVPEVTRNTRELWRLVAARASAPHLSPPRFLMCQPRFSAPLRVWALNAQRPGGLGAAL